MLDPLRRDPDHAGRTAPRSIRQASGLNLRARADLQVERDALIHALEVLDERMRELSDDRLAIVHELEQLRDVLYPPVPRCHGRRPPDIDCAPLPPAPEGAPALSGRDLRSACLSILRHHGALTLPELHGLLHRYGYLIAARRPVAALSDAMPTRSSGTVPGASSVAATTPPTPSRDGAPDAPSGGSPDPLNRGSTAPRRRSTPGSTRTRRCG